MSKVGFFTFSMDFELGWGSITNDRWRARERANVYERLRGTLRRVLAELDALEIPLTWATVGAMVAHQPQHDLEHLTDKLREQTKAFLSEAQQMTVDGRDLLEMVQNSRVSHDIGSHSFSHARFDSEGYNDSARSKDLRLARVALEKWDIDPISFVFPENNAPSLAALPQAGIRVARLAPNSIPGGKVVAKLRRPPFVKSTLRHDGVRTETGTMFFHWPVGDHFGLRRNITLSQSRRALAAAAQDRQAVHYWLHPFNLTEIPGLLDQFLRLLHEVAMLRDEGKIQVVTMANRTLL